MLVDEPGAVTPIFMPLRSLPRFVLRGLRLAHPEHDAGVLALQDQRLDVLALRLLRDRVLVGARHDVDAAAEQRLQRARTAGEVEDLDVETLGLEVALALGDRQRQVVEKRLAAHADRELGLFERLRMRRRATRTRDTRRRSPRTESNRRIASSRSAFEKTRAFSARAAAASNRAAAAQRGVAAVELLELCRHRRSHEDLRIRRRLEPDRGSRARRHAPSPPRTRRAPSRPARARAETTPRRSTSHRSRSRSRTTCGRRPRR